MVLAVLSLLLVLAGGTTVRDTHVAPEAVPALASAFETLYGPAGRSLLQTDGQYGYYYGGEQEGGYGGYYGGYGSEGRMMLEEGAADAAGGQLVTGHPPIPVGKCYCRYDTSYGNWALAENTCKDALYQLCQGNGRLPCSWLDAYYGSSMAERAVHALPNEQDIAAFLFSDCVAAPPCNCVGMLFDGSDDAAISYSCCEDLRAHCRRPAAGVTCQQVAAYCSADETSTALATWTQSQLASASCQGFQGSPYLYQSLPDILAAGQAPAAIPGQATALKQLTGSQDEAASEALLQQAQQLSGPRRGGSAFAGLLVVVVGGLVAAALTGVAMVAVGMWARRGEADADLAAPLVPGQRGGPVKRAASGLLPPTPAPSKHASSNKPSLHG